MGGFFGGVAAAKPWFDGLESTFSGQTMSSSLGLGITASSTIHTKGAYTQLIASTGAQATFISVRVSGVSTTATNTATLLDIAVGASGSEAVIVPDIAIGGAGQIASGVDSLTFFIPVSIPSNSRISARIQSVVASKTATISIALYNFGSSSLVPTSVDVLGITTGSSKGTTLAASNSWTEIISSTAKDYIAFAIVPSMSTADFGVASVSSILQIGSGASGSETAFGELVCRASTTETMTVFLHQFNLIGKEVPAGSRLSLRQSTVSTLVDGCIIAVPKP